jgi:hypothetical protein
MFTSNDKTKQRGYNYREEGLLSRFISNRMFGNPVMDGFLKRLSPWFTEMTDSVKKIQIYNNYTIDKNEGSINL